MTRVVVFLGPSLPLHLARAILPLAVYLPPARQADVVSAVETYRPQAIGLIDGGFGQTPSVWHKELLFALERGIRVFGAASMGALRAVELAPFGMVGVGEVYRLFSSGELTDDDEVAVAHGSAAEGYRALSMPLVNVRATLSAARDAGVVKGPDAELIVRVAKDLHFVDRTPEAIIARAVAAGLDTQVGRRVSTWLADHEVDLKRRDAEELLHVLRDLDDVSPVTASFQLERSASFETLYANDRHVHVGDVEIPLRDIADYAALNVADFDELNAAALNRALVLVLADMLHVGLSSDDVDAETARFRAQRQITSDEGLADWLSTHNLSAEAFAGLMRELATVRRLQHWLIARDRGIFHTRWLLDELRLRGAYPEVAEGAARQAALLSAWNADAGVESLPEDVDLVRLVTEHQRVTGWRLEVPLEVWAGEAGFEAPQDLALALARAAQTRERLRAAARALATQGGPPDAGSAAGAAADCA